MLDYYPCVQIDDGTYEINEFDGVSCYLLIGLERALLIDTGVGIGALRDFVERLTDKPYDVLITHNHRDHAGNAPLFDTVHISRIDLGMGSMIRPLTSRESRMEFALNCRNRHPECSYPWTEEDIIQYTKEPQIIPIEDGFTFDLGGRKAVCYLTPGHTPGSMVVYDTKTRALFSGDSCAGNVGIGIRPIEGMRHASIKEARDALGRLEDIGFDRKRVFCAHTGPARKTGRPLSEETYCELIELLDQIMAGTCEIQSRNISMLHTSVEHASYKGVSVDFHKDNIFKEG